jgi:endonuclease/exonuclease/phosphatase family metal-dependent hydrolase
VVDLCHRLADTLVRRHARFESSLHDLRDRRHYLAVAARMRRMETSSVQDLPDSTTERDGCAIVRVLSYNVRSMRDDVAALARVIRACRPDVVCVQEAPRFFRWRKAATRLARTSGLVYVSGGATASGPMILSSLRAHVERTEDILLPRTPGLHQRGFSTAVLRFGRARLGVLSCHLSIDDQERYTQGELLLERLSALGEPYAVVGGDFNDRPDGRTFGLLSNAPGWATRSSASTPSSPHRGCRYWGAECRWACQGFGNRICARPRITCRCWPPCEFPPPLADPSLRVSAGVAGSVDGVWCRQLGGLGSCRPGAG